MLEELDRLITYIYERYDYVQKSWENYEYISVNLKKALVKDIYTNNDILNLIINYRLFIINNFNLELDLSKLSEVKKVSSRIKAKNSIQYKIYNYIKNHNNGEIPINKCFNDLYGIRIILDEEIKYSKIKRFVESKYNGKLKCIDASKDTGYKATHIYFKNDNYSFPWELQIWDRYYEKTNISSHEKYKQDYVKWEKEYERNEKLS